MKNIIFTVLKSYPFLCSLFYVTLFKFRKDKSTIANTYGKDDKSITYIIVIEHIKSIDTGLILN